MFKPFYACYFDFFPTTFFVFTIKPYGIIKSFGNSGVM